MTYQEALNCFRGYRGTRAVVDTLGRRPVAIEVRDSFRAARLLFELPHPDREPLPVSYFARHYCYLGELTGPC